MTPISSMPLPRHYGQRRMAQHKDYDDPYADFASALTKGLLIASGVANLLIVLFVFL